MSEVNTSLFEKVQPIMAAALNVPAGDITPETQFGDMPQWDSMGHMEVMVSLNDAFGVEINPDTINALVSIAAICTHLAENGHA